MARAIRDCFRPPAIDYVTPAGRESHLHTRVTARCPDDADTEGLPSEEVWRADAAALKGLLS